MNLDSKDEGQNRLDTLEARCRLCEQLLQQSIREQQKINAELRCLYSLDEIEKRRRPLARMLQEIVDRIPSAWQYPEITCARISYESLSVQTSNFVQSEWSQKVDIRALDERLGAVEVYYTELRPTIDEGPFLARERRLLESLAARIGDLGERERDQTRHRAQIARLLAEHESERRSVSRDLHDALGQLLAGLRMESCLLRSKLEGAIPDSLEALEIARREEAIIEQLQGAVRNLMSFLQPTIVVEKGLAAALESLIRDYQRYRDIQFESVVELEDDLLDESRAIALYRIIQECLTNIVRHSKASRVCIRCAREGAALILEIFDNGIGYDSASQSVVDGRGLPGIRERVKLLNGSISITSAVARGTGVHIEVPISNASRRSMGL
ncbi:MAG: sensor histidine kinase [Deltaproteobacteria bacterium]|nr:sensor histidine kinase [Deltaproteobacteria bacterium]